MPKEKPQFSLVVVEPFAGYQRGEIITDPAFIAEVLAGPNEANVNRVTAS